MDKILNINFRGQKQYFEIFDDEIIVSLKTNSHNIKYNVALDDIEKYFFIQPNKSKKIEIACFISIFLNVMMLIMLLGEFELISNQLTASFYFSTLILGLFFFKYFYQSFPEKHLTSSKLFYFIYTKDTAERVDNFINNIRVAQRKQIRRKYFKIDPVIPYETQLSRFLWLYENEHINQSEYEVIKEELDDTNNFSKLF